MKYCTSCLMPSSRPRITFENGVCSACQWSEKKKAIDWDKRRKFFKTLIKKFIRRAETCEGKKPNVIVPWSGGKDSIYVAYKMKEFGLTPLLVTILPHLELPIGKWNREHTCEKFEHLYIALKDEKYRKLAKKYFVEQGRPKHPWETAISAVILSQADKLNIPLIVYGEEGEVEYGGDTTKDRWDKPVSKEYLMKYYWQDNLDWDIPDLSKVFFTQWSRFENWSPTEHWTFAKGKGMRDEPVRNVGTLWGNSQLSDKLQDLHMYLCFVKFVYHLSLSKNIFLPVAESGIPMTKSQSTIFALRAATPILYIILLSTFSMLSVFTAEPSAIPISSSRKAQWGPLNSVSTEGTFSCSPHVFDPQAPQSKPVIFGFFIPISTTQGDSNTCLPSRS